MPQKIVITSGFFNPPHIGHMNLLKAAKAMGDFLVVIVNNDEQVKIKGSAPFMDEQERLTLIQNIRHVDEVFLSIDTDGYVPKSLEFIAQKYIGNELIFAKGGDRNYDNLPESEKIVCRKFNIKIVGGVGGDKVQSSSWLIEKGSKVKK